MKKEHKFFLVGLLLGAVIIYSALAPVEEVPEPAKVEVKAQSNNQKITGYALPGKVDFAGEQIPMDRADVREKLDREIQVNAFWHSSTILMIKRANKWLPAIDSILKKNNVPTDFKYLAVIESGLQNVTSPKKAVGFWQFLNGTARDFGLEVNKEVDERYHQLKATEAACLYLKEAHAKFGNWTNVAASYNMGMNGLNKSLKSQGAASYFDISISEEPARYIFRILALKEIMENPKDFGFYIPEKELYQQESTRTLIVDKSVTDWVEFSVQNGVSYQAIKRLNPWVRSKKLTVSKGNQYNLLLPN